MVKNMDVAEHAGKVIFRCDDDFDLEKIFECGQCFRWTSRGDGKYFGVAKGIAAEISKTGNEITITGDAAQFADVWHDYFDLGRNYAGIRRTLCIDDYMTRASDFGAGIRILDQDRWEALCSFIISQCNNIPRIRSIIETMCRLFGDELDFRGETYYSFPSAKKIAMLEADDLAPLRCGYRAPYIIGAARAVADGTLDLESTAQRPAAEALAELKKLNGVGDKVANCVILFGLRKLDAFPIDVWMKKAIAEHYPNGFSPTVFGEYAGIAQQYMFYYQRSGNGENK